MSFDNFAALESYLNSTKNAIEEEMKKYEEVLGGILRDGKSLGPSKKGQDRWVYDVQQSLGTKDLKRQQQKKENAKDKKAYGTGEWVMLEPLSVFVGMKNRGIAELYFDVIGELREDLSKIKMAISVVSQLKVKATNSGNGSLIESVTNHVPNKVVLKSARSSIEKYSVVYNFAITAARPIPRSALTT